MRPLALSRNKLARDLAVPIARINAIVHATRAITADTALRLAAYFDTSPQFWMNLQSRYDLKRAERTLGPLLAKTVRPIARALAGETSA